MNARTWTYSIFALSLLACGSKPPQAPLAPLPEDTVATKPEPTAPKPVEDEPEERAEVPVPMSFDLPEAAATVKFTSAGSGKAKATQLRFAPVVGSHQLVQVSIEAKLSVDGQGDSTSPTVTVDMDMETTRADKTSFDVVAKVTGANMINKEGGVTVRPEELAELTRLVGSTLTSTVTSSGQWGAIHVEVPAGTSLTRELFDTLGVGLGTSILFPDKAVRKGGRWDVMLPFELAGVKMMETTSYTVASISSKQVEVTATVVVSGEDQTISEMDMSIDVTKIGGTGNAKYVFATGNVAPVGEIATTTAMTYSAQAQSFSSVLSLTKGLAALPAPAAAAPATP